MSHFISCPVTPLIMVSCPYLANPCCSNRLPKCSTGLPGLPSDLMQKQQSSFWFTFNPMKHQYTYTQSSQVRHLTGNGCCPSNSEAQRCYLVIPPDGSILYVHSPSTYSAHTYVPASPGQLTFGMVMHPQTALLGPLPLLPYSPPTYQWSYDWGRHEG